MAQAFTVDLGPAARSSIVSMSVIGAFAWRWPEGVENYEHGWVAIADVDGTEFQIRHGIGHRDAFGRSRLRTVSWVEGEPLVEGVEADDFDQSQSLLSLIRITKKHLRPGDEVPPEYAGFRIVVFADEIAAPYTYGSLAVKLRGDDIESWTRHPLLRAVAWGRLPTGYRYRPSLPPRTALGPTPTATHDEPPSDQAQAIAAALLDYGSHHDPSEKGALLEFTPNEEANALLKSDPFAFLLRVLFDQNVPAERAWIALFILKQRLGHLDPEIIAQADVAVREAVQQVPKLHRYVKRCPGGSSEPPGASSTITAVTRRRSGPTTPPPTSFSGALTTSSGSGRRKRPWRRDP